MPRVKVSTLLRVSVLGGHGLPRGADRCRDPEYGDPIAVDNQISKPSSKGWITGRVAPISEECLCPAELIIRFRFSYVCPNRWVRPSEDDVPFAMSKFIASLDELDLWSN